LAKKYFWTRWGCFWRLRRNLRALVLDFSRPGKPTDNAFIESFNSSFRQECLNEHWFLSLEDAKEKVGAWRGHYNEQRPHSSLGYQAPLEYLSGAPPFRHPLGSALGLRSSRALSSGRAG
jgi:putative transposase